MTHIICFKLLFQTCLLNGCSMISDDFFYDFMFLKLSTNNFMSHDFDFLLSSMESCSEEMIEMILNNNGCFKICNEELMQFIKFEPYSIWPHIKDNLWMSKNRSPKCDDISEYEFYC